MVHCYDSTGNGTYEIKYYLVSKSIFLILLSRFCILFLDSPVCDAVQMPSEAKFVDLRENFRTVRLPVDGNPSEEGGYLVKCL